MAEIRRHPLYSVEVLESAIGIPEESKQVALQHHERWNGGGYPNGLRGEGIGRFGQGAAICDVYDAMTSDRCYAKGMPPHEGIGRSTNGPGCIPSGCRAKFHPVHGGLPRRDGRPARYPRNRGRHRRQSGEDPAAPPDPPVP